jgi:amino acid transporter
VEDNNFSSLKDKKLGLVMYSFLSMAIIAPLAMIVGNASGSVTYAGMAAPLIPIVGAIFILFASLPIFEYTRFIPFAGGYYGLAELGFGKAVGKWVALGYIGSEVFASGILQASFIPFVVFTTVQLLYGVLLPQWLFFVIMILVLVWGYLSTLRNVRMTFQFIVGIVITEILLVVIFSIAGLSTVHTLSLAPFSISSSPTGFSGLFLGVILTGFLFYGGYGTSIPYSEEGNSQKTMWKALLIGILVTAIIGVLGMYAEVEIIGASKIGTIASSVNPAVTAFYPIVGQVGIWVLIVDYVLAIMIVATGMLGAGARVIYAMSRDNFFPKKINEIGSRLDTKRNVPSGGALIMFVLNLITSLIISSLIFYEYGYYNGMFYIPFLTGSIFVAMWYFHHIVPDLAMMRALPKKFKRKLTTPRNLFVSVISPLGGAAIFTYAFIEGYSTLVEPYTAGLVFVILTMILLAVWVVIKHHRGTLGRSFVEEKQLRLLEESK